MTRFNDNANLFGVSGGSTCAEVRCGFCNTLHNEGCDPDAEKNPMEGEWIRNTSFAGKTICECCFEKIENEILARMDDVIFWYRDILKAQRKILEEKEKVFSNVPTKKELDKIRHEAECWSCDHANENPAICPCPPACYCQDHTCKDRALTDRSHSAYKARV